MKVQKPFHNGFPFYLESIRRSFVLLRCERKAREWDQRSAKRGEELTALTKALSRTISRGAPGQKNACDRRKRQDSL